MDLSKRQTKEERIAHRAQRVANKRGKPDASSSSTANTNSTYNHRTHDLAATNHSASHHNDNALARASGTSLALKHRQASATSNPHAAATPEPSASNMLATIQTALHSQALESTNAVESIRLQVEVKERARRDRAENDRIKRETIIHEEMKASHETGKVISEHFAALESKSEHDGTGIDAKSLYAEVAAVYAETVAVLQSKDALIGELNDALTAVDTDSVECINQHSQDIAALIDSLKTQSATYETQCQASLTQLRQAFDSDRRALIQTQEQALNALYEKRKTMELTRLDTETQRESQSADALDSLRARDDEDYYLLKQELESSIAQFSEQLEEMRNLYMFNAEKLNYHSHILFARSASHRATIEHSRQMIRQWRETCSSVAAQAAKQEEQLDKENEALKQEYISLTSKLKALQSQWASTQTRQAEMYRAIHDMHETHVMQAARKLLHAQRVIATQILGFDESNYGSRFDGRDIESLTVSDLLDASREAGHNDLALTQSSSLASTVVPGLHTRHSKDQVEQLLKLLSQECDFLIDPHHVERLAPIADSLWASGDSILQACKVEDAEDLDELCALFFTDPSDATINVHPNDVTATIRQFIDKRRADQLNSASAGRRSASAELSATGAVAKSERASAADRALWQALGSTIDTDCESLWKALDGYLGEYNALLDKRAVLVTETGDMTRENQELKSLLSQYQHASINEELIIPPVHLLRTHPTKPQRNTQRQVK